MDDEDFWKEDDEIEQHEVDTYDAVNDMTFGEAGGNGAYLQGTCFQRG